MMMQEMWAKMWTEQVQLGCIPYYMFVVRDTGAQHYFGVPLVKAYEIFIKAYSSVSGLAELLEDQVCQQHLEKFKLYGITEINGEKLSS